MSIYYKKLTEREVDKFIELRIRQLREEGATEDLDLVPALKDYYDRHLADGTFVSWLAMDGEEIVGTSGMSFVEKPPYFGCPSGKIGLLSVMVKGGMAASNGEARRLVTQGGVAVNDEKATNPSQSYTPDDFANGLIVKKGKKVIIKFVVE